MRNANNQNIKIASLPKLVRLLSLLLLFSTTLFAQEKTKKKIDIEQADFWLYKESVVKDADRLIGDVILSHEEMTMKCDSAWVFKKTNTVNAYGNVHIISNDTLNMWADFINYNGDTQLAKARRNVTLEDPSLTLIADSLDFDMKEEIGYYDTGGTIIDSANVLTSRIGKYYTQTNEVYFIEDVQLENENYNLATDTMIYNTNTEVVYFEGPTRILSDSTDMYSTSGWFNTKTNEVEMDENSTIKRAQTQLQADYIYYNDNNGEGNALGHVIMNDYESQMIVVGNKAVYDDFNQYAMVSDSAMWIQYYQGDSLFLHADTLYTIPDTTSPGGKLLITYNNVRFFRTDIQGVCDSLIYFTNDSTIQMYKDPVVWSQSNQLSANFIEFFNNAQPPNEVHLEDNSFIIQQNDSIRFNQIKGKKMIGFINGQDLYKIDVNGNGQSIYYPLDGDNFMGINKAESSKITLYLKENMIKRITFSGAPDGSMNPLPENVSSETRLEGFDWREEERPASRYDIFGNQSAESQPSALPDSEIDMVLPDIEQAKIEMDSIQNKQPQPVLPAE